MNLTNETITNWSKAAGEPEWLQTSRTKAWDAFAAAPLPPHTSEAWKYTDMESLTAVAGDPSIQLPEGPLPDMGDMIFMDLHTAVKKQPKLTQTLLEQALSTRFSSIANQAYGGQRYLEQHNALWNCGYVLYVPKGVKVSTPITTTLTAGDKALFPRTLIVLEEGAELTYIEHLTGNATSEAGQSCQARTHIHCAPNSRLHYASVQHWGGDMRYIAQQHATVEKDAHMTSLSISLGSATTKTVTETVMAAPGADANIFGLTFGDGSQHIDHHTLQTHQAPNTTSNLLYKTALTDNAQGVYTGLIKMGEKAQQGAAYQSNRNLLLSDACATNAVPQLEIEANDVKCSHGATMGSIDEEQLYYLTSRGLSKTQAEQMIIAGFFEELLTELPSEDLAESVRGSIYKKLGME